jgi:hypothetical protein
MMTGCMGYNTPDDLKAETYHQKMTLDGNYQQIFQCYKEKERARIIPVDGQIYAESGLAVMDYLFELGPSGYLPGLTGWYARAELRKIDETHTAVDLWHKNPGPLGEIANVIISCAQKS